MDNDNEYDETRLGDLPERLVDWLHRESQERDLHPGEVIAVMGIVLEGFLKGVYPDADERRREAAKFSAIFRHVMLIDPVQGRPN